MEFNIAISITEHWEDFYMNNNNFQQSIYLPAMLALMKQTIEPDIKARMDIVAIILLFSGHIAPRLPIIKPIEVKFANPQIANVVIAALRS